MLERNAAARCKQPNRAAASACRPQQSAGVALLGLVLGSDREGARRRARAPRTKQVDERKWDFQFSDFRGISSVHYSTKFNESFHAKSDS